MLRWEFLALLVIGCMSLFAVVLYIHTIDNRLTFLESTIVGSCPDDVSIPEGAKCKQGFHRPQARVMLETVCSDNGLTCPAVTDDWPNNGK